MERAGDIMENILCLQAHACMCTCMHRRVRTSKDTYGQPTISTSRGGYLLVHVLKAPKICREPSRQKNNF